MTDEGLMPPAEHQGIERCCDLLPAFHPRHVVGHCQFTDALRHMQWSTFPVAFPHGEGFSFALLLWCHRAATGSAPPRMQGGTSS